MRSNTIIAELGSFLIKLHESLNPTETEDSDCLKPKLLLENVSLASKEYVTISYNECVSWI